MQHLQVSKGNVVGVGTSTVFCLQCRCSDKDTLNTKSRSVPPLPVLTVCNAHVLLILVPFLQDDSGWSLVERSLANNKQLEILTLDGCDAFLVNMGKALTKNTSIRALFLLSESL